MELAVKFKPLRGQPTPPQYQTEGAAGMDLHALLDAPDFSLRIHPGSSAMVPTGWAIEIPAGFEGQVRSRSGLAAKNQVCVLNSPGTIDSDYRGELKVILFNHGHSSFVVKNGDRIAQLVICPIARPTVEFTTQLDHTSRGSGGFGSTGV